MHFVILEYNLTFTGKIKIWQKSFSTKRDRDDQCYWYYIEVSKIWFCDNEQQSKSYNYFQ